MCSWVPAGWIRSLKRGSGNGYVVLIRIKAGKSLKKVVHGFSKHQPFRIACPSGLLLILKGSEVSN